MRDEHIEWCKKQALAYLDNGQVSEGFTSMLSDLRKHPETENHIGIMLGAGLMMIPGWIDNYQEVKNFIEGFN